MKLENGQYYLAANGEIIKTVSESLMSGCFHTTDGKAYCLDGKYRDDINSDIDLIAHIPKQLHKHILNEINSYYTDKDFKEVVDSVWGNKKSQERGE